MKSYISVRLGSIVAVGALTISMIGCTQVVAPVPYGAGSYTVGNYGPGNYATDYTYVSVPVYSNYGYVTTYRYRTSYDYSPYGYHYR